MNGLRQQQREATLKRLEQEGLLARNKALAWRRPTLRILCIGKRDSDGCRDALSILKRSGFGLRAPFSASPSTASPLCRHYLMHLHNSLPVNRSSTSCCSSEAEGMNVAEALGRYPRGIRSKFRQVVWEAGLVKGKLAAPVNGESGFGAGASLTDRGRRRLKELNARRKQKE